MLGFKRFETAAVTIRGIELAKKIKKQQFNLKPLTGKATTAPEIWAEIRTLQSDHWEELSATILVLRDHTQRR